MSVRSSAERQFPYTKSNSPFSCNRVKRRQWRRTAKLGRQVQRPLLLEPLELRALLSADLCMT